MDPADETVTLEIRELNCHLVCILCAGYFVDATTITECLHTFCKSCIVKYLQTSKFCPNCNTKIHETQPLINLRSDRTLQDIVFKLVPQLAEAEEERRSHFYRSRGLEDDQNSDQKQSLAVTEILRSSGYRSDEEISLSLEPLPLVCVATSLHSLQQPLAKLNRRFLRCSSRARIGHVVKLLSKMLQLPPSQTVEVVVSGSLTSHSTTLKATFLRHWLGKTMPMNLQCVIVPLDLRKKAMREAFEQRKKQLIKKRALTPKLTTPKPTTPSHQTPGHQIGLNTPKSSTPRVVTLTTVTDGLVESNLSSGGLSGQTPKLIVTSKSSEQVAGMPSGISAGVSAGACEAPGTGGHPQGLPDTDNETPAKISKGDDGQPSLAGQQGPDMDPQDNVDVKVKGVDQEKDEIGAQAALEPAPAHPVDARCPLQEGGCG